MTYRVKEIFCTLQGEGANAGRAAVFCRFTSCNLWTGREKDRRRAVCKFCDTDFTGTDGPGGGRFGVGNRRPRGNSGTSSSSSGNCCCCCWLPRGIAPGGRSGGSEKILPICARAGGASEIVEAAIRAAKPIRAMVRNISRL